MDRAENFVEPSNPTILARKSWVSYIFPTIFIVAALSFLAEVLLPISRVLAVFLWVISVAVYFYIILLIRSYMLFINENGVWVFRGILPWDKGVSGVKWRDLDEAVYYQGFMSWLFNAYTIKITHRFTRESEIKLTTMHMGQMAVQQINTTQQSMLAKLQGNGGEILV